MKRRNFIWAALACVVISVSGGVPSFSEQPAGIDLRCDGGEGSARIISPEYVVAGEPSSILIEFTAGDSGIPIGGGIVIGLHHAAQWRPMFQVQAPKRPGYVTVEPPPGVSFQTRYVAWIPREMLVDPGQGRWSDGIYHMAFVFQVTDTALAPHSKVMFRLGQIGDQGAIHRIVDPDHQFRIMTDVTGNGVYQGIAESPMLDIVPGTPHHLTAFCSAQVRVGEPFELQVQAEDVDFNCVTDSKGRASYTGSVAVRDEDGTLLAQAVPVSNGIGRVRLTVDKAGPRRFRVSDGDLEGRSNPCKAFVELPKYRIYWGDIHGHTGISDGLGDSCDEYFSYGRDIARLDVCALTDHGHFDWPQNVEAVKKYYEPSRFVTILAQEAGAGSDHMNYYFRRDDTSHVRAWVQDYGKLQQLVLDQYNSSDEPELATGPHHFSYRRGDDRYPFGIWDTRVCRFVEVYSSHGTSEYRGNPRPVGGPTAEENKFMQYALAQGLRFGIIASSDNHDSRPGRTIWGQYPGGLAAFLAPALTREDIWKALWDHRTYGTSFDRIYMEFTIDDHIMGSEVETDGRVQIAYEVVGKTDGVKTELLCNNQVIRTDDTRTGIVQIAFTHEPSAAESAYYLRVTQENGQRAWSTPIWVTRRS